MGRLGIGKAEGAESCGQRRNEKIAPRCSAKRICKSKCVDIRSTFKKFEHRKIARRCCAKRICKSKCAKQTMFGPLLEVQMSKNLLAAVARSTFVSQNA